MKKLPTLPSHKIKAIIWIIIIVIAIFSINSLGTHHSSEVRNLHPSSGIAKTHSTQVKRPSKQTVQHEKESSIHYSGHRKDVPGNDNNPKKG